MLVMNEGVNERIDFLGFLICEMRFRQTISALMEGWEGDSNQGPLA